MGANRGELPGSGEPSLGPPLPACSSSPQRSCEDTCTHDMASLRCTGLKALSPPPGALNAGLPLAPSFYSHLWEGHGDGDRQCPSPGHTAPRGPGLGAFLPDGTPRHGAVPSCPGGAEGPRGDRAEVGSGRGVPGPSVSSPWGRAVRPEPAPTAPCRDTSAWHTDGHTGDGKTGVSPVAPASPKGGDTISPPQNVLEQRVECFKS